MRTTTILLSTPLLTLACAGEGSPQGSDGSTDSTAGSTAASAHGSSDGPSSLTAPSESDSSASSANTSAGSSTDDSADASSDSSSGGPSVTDPVELDLLVRGLLDGSSTAWEQARDVAFDDEGSIYVVGGTSSSDFPVTAGAYDTTYNVGGTEEGLQGDTDVFVTKIDSSGEIVWSTYLGGPNYDRAYAVEVDSQHDVYIAGRAGSGFPTTAGALQPGFAGDNGPNAQYGSQDGFVTKLSADGSQLVWSTFFGEPGLGIIRDMDIDDEGRPHVVMIPITGTGMDQYVTEGAAQPARNGTYDTFYARLDALGGSVEYGTYFGGADAVGPYTADPSVRVLPDGTAYVLTSEPADGAPSTVGAFQPNHAGGLDLLVGKFDPTGALVFCTYLGGDDDENMDTHSLALDSHGNAVIGASSKSTDYPVTDGTQHAVGGDVVVSLLSADGTALLASTQLGGDAVDGAEGISVDAYDTVYVSGFTNSSDLPVTANAALPAHAGALEGFHLVLSPDLAVTRYYSYDGITGEYANRSSMVGPDGNWAVVGAVWHLDPFPATAGQDGNIDGTHAAFFSLFAPSAG